MRVHYDVSWTRPQRHLFDVSMTVRGLAPDRRVLEVQIPAWTPGAYEIVDPGKLMQELTVEVGGKARAVQQVDKHTWRVETRGAAAATLRWRAYANTLDCVFSHLDETHAHINGASFFPYVTDGRSARHDVQLQVPRGWRVATALAKRRARHTYGADDYDSFADCPIEIGTFRQETFEVRGVPHHIVVQEYGHEEQNLPRLVADTKRFVKFFGRMFRGFPFDEYWFMLHAHPTLAQGGALEHASSTHLTLRWYLDDPDPARYDWLISVMSHEYFHAWNVKRLRPLGLGPFDYTREAHTRSLWVAEGITEYYCLYSLRRAGVWSRQQLLDWLAFFVDRLGDMPGRRAMTLRESSFNTWTHPHWHGAPLPKTNALNAFVDYYTKGALVAWMLDMELRRRTGGTHTLDEVMVRMVERFPEDGAGFGEEDFQRTAEEVSGLSLAPFFRSTLDSTRELSLARTAKSFGLELSKRPEGPRDKPHSMRRKIVGPLGLEVDTSGGRIRVRNVQPDSPAEVGGLDRDDELIAVDGERLDEAAYRERLTAGGPGKRKKIALFRHGRLLERVVEVGRDARPRARLVPASGLRGRARRILEEWLGPESTKREIPSARG